MGPLKRSQRSSSTPASPNECSSKSPKKKVAWLSKAAINNACTKCKAIKSLVSTDCVICLNKILKHILLVVIYVTSAIDFQMYSKK